MIHKKERMKENEKEIFKPYACIINFIHIYAFYSRGSRRNQPVYNFIQLQQIKRFFNKKTANTYMNLMLTQFCRR